MPECRCEDSPAVSRPHAGLTPGNMRSVRVSSELPKRNRRFLLFKKISRRIAIRLLNETRHKSNAGSLWSFRSLKSNPGARPLIISWAPGDERGRLAANPRVHEGQAISPGQRQGHPFCKSGSERLFHASYCTEKPPVSTGLSPLLQTLSARRASGWKHTDFVLLVPLTK